MDDKQTTYGTLNTTSGATSSSSPDSKAIELPTSGDSKPNANGSTTSKYVKQREDPREGLPADFSFAKVFRYHMGIEHDTDLVPPHLAKRKAIDPIATGSNQGRRAVNLGIYNRAIREEQAAHRGYWIWSFITNAALGLQLIFAAVLTALGAGHGPSDAVAVFGALNTIIAGFLTYLKGTGLPMRMKYFYNQWLKLRMYIEQRERDFASDDYSNVHRFGYQELMEEIEIVEHMYSNIRKDIEKHEPDSFAGKGNTDTTGPGEGASSESMASKGINALRNRTSAATAEVVTGIKKAVNDVESKLQNRGTKPVDEEQGKTGDTKVSSQSVSDGTRTVVNSSTNGN